MTSQDADELIAGAVPPGSGTWADLGAGDGVFTRALAHRLGPECTVYAVERDADALSVLRSRAHEEKLGVIPVSADFTADFELPGLGPAKLDGMLFANSLHYVRDAVGVLSRMIARLKPDGRVVIVEYDRRGPNPWVPYPIPRQRLQELAGLAGLSAPMITATRPSTYGGDLYVAVLAIAAGQVRT